ncbi:ATPase [Dasineura jujubifolia toursvirus 2a]|nr:ATPase [Dasineura jujubifolia toursvirus 2a]
MLKLKLTNFKCFTNKEFTIPLNRGCALISAPSGSGKTTILDAIKFVLWGSSDTDIITIGKSKCEVIMEYMGYVFIRKKSPKYFSIRNIRLDKNIEDCDEFILKHFPLQQNSFMEMNSTKQMQFLYNQIQASSSNYNIDEILLKTKTALQEVNKNIANTEGRISMLKHNIETFPVIDNEVINSYKIFTQDILNELSTNDISVYKDLVDESKQDEYIENIKLIKKEELRQTEEQIFLFKELTNNKDNINKKIFSIENEQEIIINKINISMFPIDTNIQEAYSDSSSLERVLSNTKKSKELYDEVLKNVSRYEIESSGVSYKNEIINIRNDIDIINDVKSRFGSDSISVLQIQLEKLNNNISELTNVKTSNEVINETLNETCVYTEENNNNKLKCPYCSTRLILRNNILEKCKEKSKIPKEQNETVKSKIQSIQSNNKLEEIKEKAHRLEESIIILKSLPETKLLILKDKLKYNENKYNLLQDYDHRFKQFKFNLEELNIIINKINNTYNQNISTICFEEQYFEEQYFEEQYNKINTFLYNFTKNIIPTFNNFNINKENLNSLKRNLNSVLSRLNNININELELKYKNLTSNIEKLVKWSSQNKEYKTQKMLLKTKNNMISDFIKENENLDVIINDKKNIETIKSLINTSQSISIQSLLDAVNDQIRLFLDNFFSEKDISVQLQEYKVTKTGITKPQISIKIINKGFDMKISSLSSGEYARLKLAIDLSLIKVLYPNSYVPLMLDEVTSNLDSNTSTKIISTINSTFENVIIVAHQTIEGLFDTIINL